MPVLARIARRLGFLDVDGSLGQAACGRAGVGGIVSWMAGALELDVGELLEREQGLALLARVLRDVGAPVWAGSCSSLGRRVSGRPRW